MTASEPISASEVARHPRVLPILTAPARVLTVAASRVGPKLLENEVMVIDDETRALIADMRATLDAVVGYGLAAPQVGVGKRVILARLGDPKARATALINPRILSKSAASSQHVEACFSIPRKSAKVRRALSIVVAAYDEDGKSITLSLDGMDARILQHETDHLDGYLFTSRKS